MGLPAFLVATQSRKWGQDIELTVSSCNNALAPHGTAAFAIEFDGEERLVIVQEVERHAVRRLETTTVIGVIRQAVAEEHELQAHAVMLLTPGKIPKTSSGKIQRQLCKKKYLDGALDPLAFWEVGTDANSSNIDSLMSVQSILITTAEDVESWIISRIALRLNVADRDIDLDKPLSYYGLGSLHMVALIGEINRRFSMSLPPTSVFDHPTIAKLIDHVAEEIAAGRCEPASPFPNINFS